MSDPKRLAEVTRHIASIKERKYPIVVGRDDRIEERPWAEVPEGGKLAILQDAVDWSGVSNRDRAHILLSEVDPGRISDKQRNTLIDMAVAGDPRGAAVLDDGERPMSPAELKALYAEIRADEHAARVRDYGAADAATYDDRMAEAYRFREQALGPAPPEPPRITPEEVEQAVRDVERKLSDPYDRFLKAATERAMSRMQGKGRDHER
jgi:hypothetical protein